jgi:hypothetical protein
VAKPEKQELLRIHWRRWVDSVKVDLKGIGWILSGSG